eukprot:1699528-Ditylum_brightwellii.AAC.1
MSYDLLDQIARVDHPDVDLSGERNTLDRVNDATVSFFTVIWNDGTGTFPTAKTFSTIPNNSCISVSDGCICDTTVVETAVF